jgi:hypothetical protein
LKECDVEVSYVERSDPRIGGDLAGLGSSPKGEIQRGSFHHGYRFQHMLSEESRRCSDSSVCTHNASFRSAYAASFDKRWGSLSTQPHGRKRGEHARGSPYTSCSGVAQPTVAASTRSSRRDAGLASCIRSQANKNACFVCLR